MLRCRLQVYFFANFTNLNIEEELLDPMPEEEDLFDAAVQVPSDAKTDLSRLRYDVGQVGSSTEIRKVKKMMIVGMCPLLLVS